MNPNTKDQAPADPKPQNSNAPSTAPVEQSSSALFEMEQAVRWSNAFSELMQAYHSVNWFMDEDTCTGVQELADMIERKQIKALDGLRNAGKGGAQ